MVSQHTLDVEFKLKAKVHEYLDVSSAPTLKSVLSIPARRRVSDTAASS